MWALMICVNTMCAQLLYPTEATCNLALTTLRINLATKHIAVCVPSSEVARFMPKRLEI